MLESLAAALLIASTPPTNMTTAIERVALVRTGTTDPRIEVDALRARIVIHGATLAEKSAHALCPNVEIKRDSLELVCTSRRIWSVLGEDKTGLYLDVRQLRGLAPGDFTLLLRPWPLSAIAIPGGCPGQSAGPRGECALVSGDLVAAKKAFTDALGGADTNLARLRLGDFALREGDLEEAITQYSKVSFAGPIGRMARARECDLSGACYGGQQADEVDDLTGLPEPLKTELELYSLRRQVVGGMVGTAMEKMVQRMNQQPPLCEHATTLCQKLVAAGLEDANDSTRLNALAIYLSDEVRYGPLKIELATLAGKAAEKLGAPGFAAAVLSSISPTVSPEDLDAHLLRVAQLFLDGHDRIRTGFILEYADGRLGRRRGKAWQSIRRAVNGMQTTASSPRVAPIDLTKLSNDVELTTELARGRRRAQPRNRKPRPGESTVMTELIASSSAMRETISSALDVAPSTHHGVAAGRERHWQGADRATGSQRIGQARAGHCVRSLRHLHRCRSASRSGSGRHGGVR